MLSGRVPTRKSLRSRDIVRARMLVKCPQCRTEFRLSGDAPGEKVVRYFCPGCQTIVRIDVELDEIQSSSSSGSFRAVRRKRTVLVADDSDEIQKQCETLLAA